MRKNILKKLSKYAALGAAGIACTNSDAAVIYTDVNPDSLTIENGIYDVDLDNNNSPDFRLTVSTSTSSTYSGFYTYTSGSLRAQALTSGNYVMATYTYNFYSSNLNAKKLGSGETVFSTSSTIFEAGVDLFDIKPYGTSYGDWAGNHNDKYLGVSFQISGNLHYGWIRLNVNSNNYEFTVKDYAYESVPNTAISTNVPCIHSASTITVNSICDYTSPSGKIFTSSATYMDTIPNAIGCDSVMTIQLGVTPLINVNTTTSVDTVTCPGDMVNVLLNTSQIGMSYYLLDNSNDTLINGPITGTGNALSISTQIDSDKTINLFGSSNAIDASLEFDGSNDYVDCGNDASLQITGNEITLEAWVYPTSFKSQVWAGNVINKGSAGPDAGYMLRVGNNGQVNFNLGNGSWNEINSSTGAVAINTWHHIAGSYDGTTMRLYVDGVEVATGAFSGNIGNGTNSLYLGEDPEFNGREFPGMIDEARVWNKSRTIAEINASKNACLSGNESGLVGYWNFNHFAGTNTVSDLTANGNDGTLQNMDRINDWSSNIAYTCNTCNFTDVVTIYVESNGSYVQSPSDTSNCVNNDVYFTNMSQGNIDSLTWQVSTNNGGNWTNIILPSGNYTGSTDSLHTSNLISSMDGNLYRSVAYKCGTEIDSTTNSILNVNPEYTGTIDTTINFDESILFDGNEEDVTGTYNALFKTSEGCDSLITLNLTVTPNPNGIDERVGAINIFPNPAKDLINFNAEGIINEIIIYDARGVMLINKKVNNTTSSIELNNIESGIYIYEIRMNNNSISRGKIIKE